MQEVSRRALLKGMGGGAAAVAGWALLRIREDSGHPTPGCLFGIHTAPRGEERSFREATLNLESRIGRRFGLDRKYYRWDEDFPTAYDRWTSDQGRLPCLSWNARTAEGGFEPWGEIAAGTQDERISMIADGCARFGSPIFLTFSHEPENDTNIWGTEDEFIAAWRRVHGIFGDRGAGNVSWVWIMTASSFRRRRADRWYPGDRYVDLIGGDGYNWFGCRYRLPWLSFERVFSPFYAYGLERGKPMLVGEWGSIEDPQVPGRKAAWIRDAAETLKSWPEVRAVAYFNAAPGGCPWWLDSSPSSLEAFAQMGRDPHFRGP